MIEVDWRVAFVDYIQEHKLAPGVDPKSAEDTRILRCSKGYVLVGGSCGRTNLNYTDSSTRVLTEGLPRTSNGIKPWVCRVTSR
jgi:hypothetical protein